MPQPISTLRSGVWPFALLPALLLAACSAQTDGGEEDLSKTGEDDFTSNQANSPDF